MNLAVLVFGACLGGVIYILFGYPLLLAWLSHRTPRPVQKNNLPDPSVSILLPVRNGEQYIARKLASITGLRYPRELVQVIVVCDGCEDRTEAIARAFSSAVTVIAIPAAGKAAALNRAMREATGEILFFTDVRQSLEPNSLAELVARFADPKVGVASGELIIRSGKSTGERAVGLYWRYEKWIRKSLSRIDSVLGATGCIYAMRRELARPLPPGILLDDVYEPLAAFFRGYRVILVEEAIAIDDPTSLSVEFRRKVRTLAGVYQILYYYPALLGPSNRMWIHFLSHKLGRLLLPYALLAMAASSFALPAPWKVMALACQGAFYGSALLDGIVPEYFPAKRLFSLARTFLGMMAAAFCAPWMLFVPSRKLWRPTGVRREEK